MGAGEKNNLVAAEVMPEGFYEHVSGVLDAARRRAYAAVNFAMVEAYWEIGRSIVEQQGGLRARGIRRGAAPGDLPAAHGGLWEGV